MATTGGAAAGGDTNVRTVFAGLMVGMLVAAVAQTIIAPAMPRIVAELGGMEHYSWIAVSALLASTVIVPIVGKLSDLFGRKAFYVGGIVVFMASSLVAGLSTSFEMFMAARVLEGLGMGTMMPLSQAIIGDIVPPRERGKYQGLMGGVFGLSSIVGPFLGGWITDNLGWRWLFFVNIPVGIVALCFIIPFMRLRHEQRAHRIDYAGFVTLSVGLTTCLLATVWGGAEYPWGSPRIVGLYALGGLSLLAFAWIETRAVEPVMPLRLWKNPIFTAANVANMAVAMAMFGAIYFIPVYVQGVMGRSVTGSGAVLTPMMLSLVAMSAISGQVISRTGRYKLPVLIGIALMGTGLFLLARMDGSTSYSTLMRNMVLVGLGLGTAMPTFVLIVQNAVAREDLGVATATTQLSRSIGSTVGVAVLGTIMSQRLAAEMARLAPGGSAGGISVGAGGGEGAGALLDPAVMARLPAPVLEAFREALATALHGVFVATVPIAGVAFVAALLLREIPLRRSAAPADAEETGKDLLAELNHAGGQDEEPVLGRPNPAYESRTAFLGLVFGLLASEAERDDRERLRDLLARMGEGDGERGRQRLDAVACALLRECEGEDATARVGEAIRRGTVRLDGLEPRAEYERAVAGSPRELREHLRMLVAGEEKEASAVLTPADLDTLERIGIAASAALLLDLRRGRSEGGGRSEGE